MIIFDSNRDKKWTGRGLSINNNNIVLHKNGNIKHNIQISSGSYLLKVFAKNRIGSGSLYIKILNNKGASLFFKKIKLSKVWQEETCSFLIKKGEDNCDIVVYRDKEGSGSIDVGRITVDVKVFPEYKKHKEVAPLIKEEVKVNNFFKKKIAFVVPYAIYGGAEIYIKRIINNINEDLFTPYILYIRDNPLKTQIKSQSVIHKKIPSEEALKDYIKANNFDYIIYYNSILAYKLVISSIKHLNIKPKLVEIYHSDFKWSDSLSSIKSRDDINLLFSVSDNLGNDISGVKKKVTIPVPIDIDKYCIREPEDSVVLNLREKKDIIGVVARLSKEKNLDYVLALAKHMNDYNFLIFGEGPERQHLQLRIANEKIDNVYLIGFKRDLYRYYSKFNAFLLTSDMEGTPISILEAMSCGLPVFVPNVGNIKDIVKDKETGFFITKNVQSDSLLIRNNMKNFAIGKAARKYVEEAHNQNIIANNFMNELLDIQNQFKKRKNEKLLVGEYV